MNAFITILCTLSLLLLVKLACRTTWRPARTVLGIGRQGQSRKVDKRKLQQNESDQNKKLRHHKGPGQRQDSLELSPRHNNLYFKHAQTTDQPWLNKADPERDKHYHRPKKRRKCLLSAAALLILWLVLLASTVTNGLSRLLPHTTNTWMGELRCTATNKIRHASDVVADFGADQEQAELQYLSQRSLAFSQQPNNSDAHLAELPCCKQQWLALQAIQCSDTRVSGLDTPSTDRSKSILSAQHNNHSLQRKRLIGYWKVLPWQVALTFNLVMSAADSETSCAEKLNIKTRDTLAHCLPPPFQRSNTTQLKVAATVQNLQAMVVNRATIASLPTMAMLQRNQHLPTRMHHTHFCTKPVYVWPTMYKYAVPKCDHVLMSWTLKLVEHTLLATPIVSDSGYMVALKTTVIDHLSKIHLHATLRCMTRYLLAFTLLTC